MAVGHAFQEVLEVGEGLDIVELGGLESRPGSPVHRSAALHLGKIRRIVDELAREVGLAEPENFAQAWHMLMKGSIVSACEGNRNAARDAKQAAGLVLDGWKRAK